MGRVTGRHSTLHKGQRQAVARILNCQGVRAVTLGHTRHARSRWPSGTVRLKRLVEGGINLLVHGERGFTDVYVWTSDPSAVCEELRIAATTTQAEEGRAA